MAKNPTPQNVYTQLSEKLFCGDCKAARMLIWTKDDSPLNNTTPPHSGVMGEHWYAVHCDYFRRRIELPDQLERCGAHQKKD